MSIRTTCVLALALGVVAAPAALAEQATMTLFPSVAVWNDTVEVRIEGVGCDGQTETPVVQYENGVGWVIDIDLNISHCPVTAEFSTVAYLGPLPEADYTVRLQDAVRHVVSPPPPPLDIETLKVYRQASVDIDLPDAATDTSPIPLAFRGPASSSCYMFEPPQLEGRTITALFSDNCPILPRPGPVLIEEEFELGPLPAGAYDVAVFEWGLELRPRLSRRTLTIYDSDGCVPSETTLCLQGGRFKVEVDWKDFAGKTGRGYAVPLASGGDSGLFWFFAPGNIELTVKALDGCGYNQRHWVFISSGTTVEYTVTVTDMETGAKKEYRNEAGVAAALVADTAAFPCSP